MKITRHTDMIVNGRLSHSWYEGKDGTHVPLPLDVAQVPDAVVVRARDAFDSHIESTTLVGAILTNADVDLAMRAAIAALAASLAEES
jgi:hypothetical protein